MGIIYRNGVPYGGAANAVRFKGGFSASGDGTINGGTTTLKSVKELVGDMYVCTSAGTIYGIDFKTGDSIIFKTTVAAGTAPTSSDIIVVKATESDPNHYYVNAYVPKSQETSNCPIYFCDQTQATVKDTFDAMQVQSHGLALGAYIGSTSNPRLSKDDFSYNPDSKVMYVCKISGTTATSGTDGLTLVGRDGTSPNAASLKLTGETATMNVPSGTMSLTCSGGMTIKSGNWPTGSGNAAHIKSDGTLVKNTSSIKYKQKVNYKLNSNDYHNQIMQLKPCTYEYIEQPYESQLGLIAEDVYEVNPNIVVYDINGQIDSIKDRDLITLLIIESQYKDQQIQALQSEIELLKQRLDNLES